MLSESLSSHKRIINSKCGKAIYSATNAAKPTATAPPRAADARGIKLAAALPVVVAAVVGVGVASASCTPKLVVVVTWPPLRVVVTTLLAVVVALQPAQLVQGPPDAQGPAVHPLQVAGGQAWVPV